MLSLVESTQANDAEREALMNKIIAAGLNSIIVYASSNQSQPHPDRVLLEKFAQQSFDKILPCWSMLDDKVKFFIFKSNVEEFENFMRLKSGVSNV